MSTPSHSARTCFVLAAGALFTAAARAQVTTLASVNVSGAPAHGNSYTAALSHDGRHVVFYGEMDDLVPGDTNGLPDVFLRDRISGTTERISVATSGAQGSLPSSAGGISADGRFVAFDSASTNLVAGDTNARTDGFLRDRWLGTTERVTVSSAGVQGNEDSFGVSVSDDGRYVAFSSAATNLVPNDTNGSPDVFVRDRVSGTTRRVSVTSSGVQGNALSVDVVLSGDGRQVAFYSASTNLVPNDTNAREDVFVHELLTGVTTRVSVTSAGIQADGQSLGAAISRDGRFVVFDSDAANLVPGDTNGQRDVFLRDRLLGTTRRVSVTSAGAQGSGFSANAAISAAGDVVAFYSRASDLVPGDTNGFADVFVHDVASGTTSLASLSSAGTAGNDDSFAPRLSGDGRIAAFVSAATNLDGVDVGGFFDVFVRDRDATGFESLCEPATAGVAPCPCSNPPSGPGRGCDNAQSTGGARLTASGIAYASADGLVFTTAGESPSALSILVQGDAVNAAGFSLGHGVGCATGRLVRLYTKNAQAGSIVAPDPASGEPSITVRSAQKGAPIAPGESRWYAVYYRDPAELAGCTGASRFNVTQVGRIAWGP